MRLKKWMKLVVGVLLLPVCIGAGFALFRVVRATGAAHMFWVAFLAGAVCWLAIFLLLPRPMLAYVFGHELTHALWAWACGGQVKKFKASAKGGHVILTKSNFVIALAPYFFPLYAVLVTLLYLGGDLIWNWPAGRAWFHLLLGAAYAFHVTLTWHILRTQQTDITEQGLVFSGVVIWIGNLLVLLVGIPLFTAQVRLLDALAWWLEGTARVFHWLARIF